VKPIVISAIDDAALSEFLPMVSTFFMLCAGELLAYFQDVLLKEDPAYHVPMPVYFDCKSRSFALFTGLPLRQC